MIFERALLGYAELRFLWGRECLTARAPWQVGDERWQRVPAAGLLRIWGSALLCDKPA